MPVYKSGNVWKIHNVPGSHPTKAQADAQLRAIEASKHSKGKGKKK